MQLLTWKQVPAQGKQGAGCSSLMAPHLFLPKSGRKKSPPPSKVHLSLHHAVGRPGGLQISVVPSLPSPLGCPDPGEISQELAVQRGLEQWITRDPSSPHLPASATLLSAHCDHSMQLSVLSQISFSDDLQVWEDLTKPSKIHQQ